MTNEIELRPFDEIPGHKIQNGMDHHSLGTINGVPIYSVEGTFKINNEVLQ